ncbi:hypothetical protein B296_00021955 [Ensete ventricosum]|uniref:Uncharacterized protein n=1 Tax=Ensete ventricosum TaxID=4639 RepID=A0A426XU31_ENSVE|nr:hypothetical protein B296_00021955 [Ensete ventricosum]
MHRVDTVGNRQERVRSSLRVSGVYQDSAKEFVRRKPRLVGRLSGVAEKLAGSCQIGRRFGLHPKKIDNGRQCASRRRTQEWM